jgi:hypothetical protein
MTQEWPLLVRVEEAGLEDHFQGGWARFKFSLLQGNITRS